MVPEVSRRQFMERLGMTIGAVGASAGALVLPTAAEAQAPKAAKGTIPDKPYKTGHMTFFTGPAAVLGEQSYKGHILAAEEINAQGGLLGKRKIETLKADEAAGTDANVNALYNWAWRGNRDVPGAPTVWSADGPRSPEGKG